MVTLQPFAKERIVKPFGKFFCVKIKKYQLK